MQTTALDQAYFYRVMLAIVAAAALACAFTIFTATAKPNQDDIQGVDADGFIIGSACSQQAWPYYDADCLLERPALVSKRSLRIVTTERW